MTLRAKILLLAICVCAPVPPAWGEGDTPPPAKIYAATHLGGVYRSLDGGLHWLALGADPRPVQALHKSLALGRGPEVFVATTGSGVFALGGEGEPYLPRNEGLRSENVRALSYDPETGCLRAGTWGAGVFLSCDGGGTWTPAMAGLTTYHVRCLVPDPGSGRLYCGTQGGLFVGEGAAPWASVPGLEGCDLWSLAVLPGGNRLYAGLGQPSRDRVRVSDDGGRTWRSDNRGLPKSTVYALCFDPSTGWLLAGTSSGVYRKASPEARWSRWGSGLSGVRVSALASLDGYLYAATARGLFGIGPDGGLWQGLSGALEASAVTDVVVRR